MRNLDNKDDAIKEAWLQVFEINDVMDNEEIDDETLDALHLRVKAVMQVLHQFVPEDMSEEEAENPSFILSQY